MLDLIDDMPEKLCLKCGECWPATQEFFFRAVKGYLRSPCKACIAEQKATTNASKPCCVPGCNQPRYQNKNGIYTHRCWEHRYYVAVTKVLKLIEVRT